jgi:hypothetical protein
MTTRLIYVSSDLSEAFNTGEYANLFRQDWLLLMVKDVRSNRDFSDRTIQTARWAREQIKRQTGESPFFFLNSELNDATIAPPFGSNEHGFW